MGFYNLETLKEDARRHGIQILNPDINKAALFVSSKTMPSALAF